MKLLLLGLGSFLFCSAVRAEQIHWQAQAPQGFSARVAYPAGPLPLAERLPVKLELTYPAGYSINPEQLKYHLQQHLGLEPPPFKVVDMQVKEEIQGDDARATLSFVLDPQVAGHHPFSFWTIAFTPKPPADPTIEILSDVFKVAILPPEIPLPSPMIAPQMTLAPTFPIDLSPENRHRASYNPALMKEEAQRNVDIFRQRKFPWIGLLALSAGLALALGGKKPGLKKRPVSKEFERLLAKNHALRQLRLLDESESDDEFYTKLVDILRIYIEEYYGIPAENRTTQEFIEGLAERKEFTPQVLSNLEAILELADTVKFAHSTSTNEQERSILKLIYAFIETGDTHG